MTESQSPSKAELSAMFSSFIDPAHVIDDPETQRPYECDGLTIYSEGLDSAGFDLLALMNGSEGLLGIVTEITVKLLAQPEHSQVVMAAFDSVASAGAAAAHVISAGIVPAALEMMDSHAIRAAEKYAKAGYPTDAAAAH